MTTSGFLAAWRAARDAYFATVPEAGTRQNVDAWNAMVAAFDTAGPDSADVGTGWRPSDQGLLSWSLPPGEAAAEVQMVDGTAYLARLHIPTAAPITNLHAVITTAGTTLANAFLGLYTTAGVMLARTADLTTSWDATGAKKHALAARITAGDGHTTSGQPTITSATAAFSAADVGKTITGTGIPGATTILSVQSPTAATLSANATGTATTTVFTIGTTTVTPTAGTDLLVVAEQHGTTCAKLAASGAPASVLNANMATADFAGRFMLADTGLTSSIPYQLGSTGSNTTGSGLFVAVS